MSKRLKQAALFSSSSWAPLDLFVRSAPTRRRI
jgi:hypothetical protein